MLGSGWKGKVGAAGGGLAALGALLASFSEGTLSTEKLLGYVSAIGLALAAFGIRQAMGPSLVKASPMQVGPAPRP